MKVNITILFIAGFLTSCRPDNHRRSFSRNSKRPIHHQQLITERRKILRNQELPSCTSSLSHTFLSLSQSTNTSRLNAGALSNETVNRKRRGYEPTCPCAYIQGEEEVIRLNDDTISLPNRKFTLAFKVKLEGGQNINTVAVGE